MRVREGEGHMWMWDSGLSIMNWGMMFFIIIFCVIVLGLLIYGIIFLIKGTSGKNRPQQDQQALDILKERFAQGELTEDEYRQKRNLLLEK